MKNARRHTGRLAPVLAAGALLAAQTQAQSLTFTKLWSIGTGVRDYVTTDPTERGVAVHPLTGDVILVSRAGGLKVVVLAGDTAEELSRLDTTGIGGGTCALSAVAIADDGVIYAANLVSQSADFQPFTIYRWADASAAPTIAYQGNPSDGQRFGDCLDVRGSGRDTQLAAGTGNAFTGVRFTIFATTNGKNFIANNFSPTGVGAGSLQKGITFGPGNTVIGKTHDQDGQYISFDLATGNSSLLKSVPIASAISPVDFDVANKLLAGVNYATHQLLVYDGSDPGAPLQLGSFAFPTPVTANGNGVGAVDFGAGKLVAVDTQNGIVAYTLRNPGQRPTLSDPKLLPNGQFSVILAGNAGATYAIEASSSLQAWTEVATQTLDAPTMTISVPTGGAPWRFYRAKLK